MGANVVDFLEHAFAVGYPIKDLPDDYGYLPAVGEHVDVYTPDRTWLGTGEVLQHDPTGPYVALSINGCTIVAHLADVAQAPYRGDVA